MGQIILKTGPQLIVKLDKVTVEMNELIDVAAITVLIVITAIVVIRANKAITCFTGIAAKVTITIWLIKIITEIINKLSWAKLNSF